MTKQNESFAQLLKMEIMERYGLREDQVRLELNISTTDLNLGSQILSDFSKYEGPREITKEQNCESVFGEIINYVSVHQKDGFYGTYVNDTEGENND